MPERLVFASLTKQMKTKLGNSKKKELQAFMTGGVYFCDHRFNSWFNYTIGSIIIVQYSIIVQHADQQGVRSIIVV